ncbi:antitoxin VapB [Cellulosimicrobium aquatile]|uniref:Antitoxin n=2 Tax=Cellulosimicrobium TaxID=157920 RepID=A0A4Y8QYP9_9MICO|nr:MULTISPECIES: type II toxin-antitoxin system VapB family antitoxin [Cellulosimicrobium]MDQ8042824.1 type II toxin-antitoxin system VapB family antitoxin [Cellulosimicrobium sp. XJ-DQ-B-000]TFF06508.1 antitoxin [Cellulosimicrobium funkei]TGA69967.1 antitoxin [Cellulosimicrobium terreum]SIQ70938.1 antitoxin VapB [Cellulosimicrobium aquatile]
MVRTTVFRSNRTQAVRLPKAVALPDDVREVDVRAIGRSRVITPAGSGWDEWFEHGLRVGPGFLADRDQGTADEREAL